MKKTFYYTLDINLIKVYLIDGNVPKEVCKFIVNNNSDLSLKVETYLIENNLYCIGCPIKRL